jgi:hypothetical protein
VWGNFQVTDNRAVGPADFNPYTFVVPQDARLPDGGGYSLQFFDITPSKFGQFDNFITFAKNYGTQRNHYNGVDVSLNARFPFGVTGQGGFSTGNVMEDDCAVGEKVPESTFQRRGGGTLNPVQSIRPVATQLLSSGVGMADAGQGPGHLHRAEDRRVDQRNVPEQAVCRSNSRMWRRRVCPPITSRRAR